MSHNETDRRKGAALFSAFPVISIAPDASTQIEQMGSKEKFWFEDSSLGRCLYKIARPNIGEDWSEKIAEQLAATLGLPHARYELAAWKDSRTGEDTRGVLSPTIVPEGGSLRLGNELLVAHVQGVTDAVGYYNQRHNTLQAIVELLQQTDVRLPPDWNPPRGVAEPLDLFLGYLFLDAWIGNTDRHDENWACVEQGSGCEPPRYLAPTFDHASCLGRNISDAEREKRLNTNDVIYSVAAYAAKAKSPLSDDAADKRRLTVREVYQKVAAARPEATRVWQERLANVADDAILALLARVPQDRLSALASHFAYRLLHENRQVLLNL